MRSQLVGRIVVAVVFVACIVVIVTAQQIVGWLSLLAMFLSLAVLIVLLYLFNRKHR